ncbi:MAG TPA: SulP family inorganic anion transporter, partial [Miltoncostaeales bacterium]|nr:SulP family inorganic anion transporter [Miltoncostaeales bacterium]
MHRLLTAFRFRPRILDAVRGYSGRIFAADLAAGVTVGIVALPLAMAFAIASGVKPEQGIFTAIIASLLIGLLGGSNVQIGGPAGAFIVVVYGIVQQYGLANLLIATVMAGVLLFAMGMFRLGGIVRYIPVSIVIGFTNGIAVLIGLSQLKDLLGLEIPKMPAEFGGQVKALWDNIGDFNLTAFIVGMASLVLVLVWPKAYSMPLPPTSGWQHVRRVVAHVPGTIVALALATIATIVFDLDIATIGSRFGGIPSGLPSFVWPEFSFDSFHALLIPTLTIALLGAIESLLCARVADNLTPDMPRHDPNQELMAQGAANIVAPFFGGIPATGTIARTVTNVRAGARTPVAALVHAATLLTVILAAAPLAQHVPLAALAGLLLFVAWNMGEWSDFGQMQRYAPTYRSVVVVTFLLTIVFGLTVAVEVGIVMASVFFIWRMSQLFRAEPIDAGVRIPDDVVAFELFGSLFFGAVGKVETLEEQIPKTVHAVILEMH